MSEPLRRFTSLRAAAALPLALLLAGCEMSLGNLAGRATDEWVRSYQLTPGGEVRIANINGSVDVQGVDGSTVDVRAERIARAATDEGARDLLPRIGIKEEATPNRVSIETEKLSGVVIGVATEVRYHVRAPRSAVVQISNSNGRITLTGLAGQVSARTTNGGVAGTNLSGPVTAGATNGGVNIELTSLAGPVDLRTTNGGVALTLPDTARADVDASCTNGGVSVSGFKLDAQEQTRRRVLGRLNGGGTSVKLHTTNGGVRLSARTGDRAGQDK
ncbi:MAG: DUF4097 family beta strand repeat-containing protein [Betaproteobacteria bacterium]